MGRYFLVNINTGNVHEADCEWLMGRFDADTDRESNYREVPASELHGTPSWKLCAHCSPSIPVAR